MGTAIKKRQTRLQSDCGPMVLRLRPVVDLSEDQFFMLCQLNRDLRIERTAEGELELMAPVGGETGGREAEIIGQVYVWAKQDGRGISFSSATGFRLPNGATRSPDAAWMPRTRYEAIPRARRRQFIPACPDFVVELRSPSDRLSDLQDKMAEYIDNGARLGWLIDPAARRVYVYRADAAVEVLDNPESLQGDPVLPGFVLDLNAIWQ